MIFRSPAGRRPAGGRLGDTHRPGSWAGRPDFRLGATQRLGPVWDPLFDQNPSFLQGFIRVWLQKGVIFGPAEAALEPGRTST